jgi:hypothetical protein
MATSLLGSIDVPPDFQQRIGRIAVEWSWIEMLLGEMLAHFCRADHGSMYVITQSVSGSTITDWLRTLAQIKVKDDAGRKVITDLLAEVDTARSERNTYVHGIWNGHEECSLATVQTFKWDRAEVAQTAVCSIPDLDDVIAHLESVQLMLGNLGLRMGFLRAE